MPVPPSSSGRFPHTRLRRTRRYDWSRRLVREHQLTVNDLILPLFVMDGTNGEESIPSMPGVSRLTIDRLVLVVRQAADIGIPAVAVFPVTPADRKSENGDEATNPDNLICRALRDPRRGHRCGNHRRCRAGSIYNSRPGWSRPRRRCPQRRIAGHSRSPGRCAGRCRQHRDRSLGHDGRTGGSHPGGARCSRP